MVFKNLCVLVLWTKVASALEWLKREVDQKPINITLNISKSMLFPELFPRELHLLDLLPFSLNDAKFIIICYSNLCLY